MFDRAPTPLMQGSEASILISAAIERFERVMLGLGLASLLLCGGPGGSFGQLDLYVVLVEGPKAEILSAALKSLKKICPGSSVAEPSSFLMLFAGLLVIGPSVGEKWFWNYRMFENRWCRVRVALSP